jgi:hypothetical protein
MRYWTKLGLIGSVRKLTRSSILSATTSMYCFFFSF